METVPARPASRLWLHLLLFALTVFTTYSAYAWSFGGSEDLGALRVESLAFSLSLMAILGSHEMGHYVLARIHKVDTSLPYFIPLPYVGVGTLGAVIRIRGRIPHRNALVDIGAAGPLAGLAVALPILLWGLGHSQVVDAPAVGATFPGENSLWVLLRELFTWAMAELTHAPAAPEQLFTGRMQLIFGDSLLMQGLTRLAVGPLPEGKDVLVHPVVIAGWFGLLVTLLNLLPVGQLDGGHLAFALLGPRARWVGKGVALVLFLLTLFATASWGVWLLVTSKLVGFGHPEVLEPEVPLSRGRKWICALCLVALIGCAMPVPLRQVLS
ncbi:site-2 protease family protein [Hyalangium sp.]|uniref:site-2 protease family protein n=1 Tax=Hyalangium sp. TaxID=2028555 RepID=UPI002D4FFDA1|nr:site-2 protease family protein [Hyalangium sp.]HYH98826.1 site-2 protease family protein [Hyalangium sp.]